MMLGSLLLIAFVAISTVVEAAPAALNFGIEFGAGSKDLPTLTLDYAKYKAYSYDVTDDVCSPSK